jgi:hypothetical protein
MRKPPQVKTEELQRPTWVFDRARLVILRSDRHSVQGEALLGGRKLGRLLWSLDGRILHEQPLDAQGRHHGVEVERDNSGKAVWCAGWVHGSMHGPVIQFDEHGHPLMVTYFVRGRGTDIWMSGGHVSEIREMEDAQPHGLVRWGNPTSPSEEGYFFRGRRHGIFRKWESDGTLKKGYPQYYVEDKRISRLAYEKACEANPVLPPYNPRQNGNRRALPGAVRDALARARKLRRELALIAIACKQQ